MANLKSLAKDTVIYGFSSIVGRFLNYLLVPLYTQSLSAASGGYGVITNIYGYVALLLVILTFGMETTFFRFANKSEENPNTVYSTTLIAVGIVALAFIAAVLGFLPWIAPAMGYADHPSYIGVMAVVVGLDAFQAIPFAYLRYKHRPIKFAALKLLFIILNIFLNLCFFLWLPALYKSYPDVIGKIYDPTVGAGYAFYLNLGLQRTENDPTLLYLLAYLHLERNERNLALHYLEDALTANPDYYKEFIEYNPELITNDIEIMELIARHCEGGTTEAIH